MNDKINFESILGINLELLYYIQIIELAIVEYEAEALMNDLWYGAYDSNNCIMNTKYSIYKGVATYLLKEKPDNIDEIIKGVELIFQYFDNKILINKLTNPCDYNNRKEFYYYKLDNLRTPKFALWDLQSQLACSAC